MTSTTRRTDHQLKAAILDELSWTTRVGPDRIGVSVNQGAIVLSGEVDAEDEREAAVAAAQHVAGVTAVADEIMVRQSNGRPNDADIARNADKALRGAVMVPDGSVKATVHDHVVTLVGTTDWPYQREAARQAVEAIAGVRWVNSKVHLRSTPALSEREVQAEVTGALRHGGAEHAKHIAVHVHGRQVSLVGWVSSEAERQEAEHALLAAPAVTVVHNHLEVRDPTPQTGSDQPDGSTHASRP
jgi:osmotically-inducible protein OsmY